MHEALLIHGGALGDFVMSLRVVAALLNSGMRHVSVLGRAEYAALARHAAIHEYLDLNTGGHHTLFSDEASPSAELRQRLARSEIAVDMLAGPDSPLHRKLSSLGIPHVFSIDPRPRPGWQRHISDQWLEDMRAGGLAARAGPPTLMLERWYVESLRLGLLRLFDNKGPIALIHPGSGLRDKCWSVERFIRLIDELRSQQWCVAILIGPVELERFDSAALARLRAAAVTMENRTLDEVAGLIAAADLFIGNDSGVSHLAAAVGTPTIAIFGPTDPRLWRPLGDQVAAVSAASGRWPAVMDILAAVGTIVCRQRNSAP